MIKITSKIQLNPQIRHEKDNNTIYSTKIKDLNSQKNNDPNYIYSLSKTGIEYFRTSRESQALINAGAPHEFFNYRNMQGKKALDVGTGGGSFVIELIKNGVKAIGIDIAKSNNKIDNPKLFKIRDASNTKFADKTFDFVYSSYSVFYYHEKINFKIKVLKELKRITKNQGKIRLGPLSKIEILKITKKIGDLKITNITKGISSYFGRNTWVELTKIK